MPFPSYAILKKITIKPHDASIDEVRHKLVMIKNELHKIGVNINQVTHYFNGHPDPAEKRFLAKKILSLYQKIGEKTAQLMVMVSTQSLMGTRQKSVIAREANLCGLK